MFRSKFDKKKAGTSYKKWSLHQIYFNTVCCWSWKVNSNWSEHTWASLHCPDTSNNSTQVWKAKGVTFYSSCIKHILDQTSNSSNKVSSAAVQLGLIWGGVMIQRMCWSYTSLNPLARHLLWYLCISSRKPNANWQCTPPCSVFSFRTNLYFYSNPELQLIACQCYS